MYYYYTINFLQKIYIKKYKNMDISYLNSMNFSKRITKLLNLIVIFKNKNKGNFFILKNLQKYIYYRKNILILNIYQNM